MVTNPWSRQQHQYLCQLSHFHYNFQYVIITVIECLCPQEIKKLNNNVVKAASTLSIIDQTWQECLVLSQDPHKTWVNTIRSCFLEECR